MPSGIWISRIFLTRKLRPSVAARADKMEMRAKGRRLSLPVSASYGFEDATGEVHLKVIATDARMIDRQETTSLNF
jgi:hypothetical protein